MSMQEEMCWHDGRLQGSGVAAGAAPRGTVIKGETADGHAFRPRDWAHRLATACAVSCRYCDGTPERRFNPHVQVTVMDGVPSVWLSPWLGENDPARYDFLVKFGSDNDLQVLCTV